MWRELVQSSLRVRLLLSLLLGVGLTLAAFLLVIDSMIDRQVQNTLDERLAARAGALVEDIDRQRSLGAALHITPPVYGDPVYFEVRDRDGRVLATSGSLGELPVTPSFTVGDPFDVRLRDNRPARAIILPASSNVSAGSSARNSVVVVAEDRTKTDELSNEVDFILWTGYAAVLVICAGIALLTVRMSLKPLQRAATAAERISVEEPHMALPLGGMPREILPLGEQINSLLERLRAALDRERGFSENLAHELRTPIAEIRALSETAARDTGAVELRSSLVDAGRAAARMQSVTESLLAMARASRQTAVQSAEPLDLARLVRTLLADRTAGYDATGTTIIDRLPTEVWAIADAVLVRMILSNLLDNALRHGHGGPIEIEWLEHAGADAGTLLIRNPAPQLSLQDLKSLGTRWWRHSPARGSRAAHGSGLGLSIALALCEAVELTLQFALDAPERLSVTLSGFRGLHTGQ
ncbi:MAG: sensor histidine kinase [Steroidobacteraceae bacterium]